MRNYLPVPTILKVLTILVLLGLTSLGLWLIGIHLGAEYHLRQARQALTRQRYAAALGELQQALSYRPRSAELHLLAGRVARQAGNFSVAQEHLQRCRAAQQGISAELQLEEYLLRAQKGELEEVYRYLAPYLFEEGPQTPLVLEALAHVYIHTYRFDLASQCLHRWLHLQPENVAALHLRGTYYTLKLNDDSAIADFRHVLELDPDRVAARVLLGQTLKLHYHTAEAAKEFEIVLEQDPSSFAGRVGLASCHIDGSRWPEARSCLEQLSRVDWENAEVLYLRGRIAVGEGKLPEAASLFEAALAANPADNSACYHLAQCYQRLGDETSAGKTQERLDQIEKDQKRLLAITNEEKAGLSSNPTVCCELGGVCLRLGIKERGLYWLNTALRLDPHYWPAHEKLLHFYEQLGDKGEKEASFHREQLAKRPMNP